MLIKSQETLDAYFNVSEYLYRLANEAHEAGQVARGQALADAAALHDENYLGYARRAQGIFG